VSGLLCARNSGLTAAARQEMPMSPAMLFDTSSAGKLRLTGPDAPAFVANLSTNDIKPLPLGGGCPTYFCDHRAKALFQAWVYHTLLADGQHALWLETTPGRNEALFKHLDRYLISEQVEIEDVTATFAQLHLAGENAKAVLEKGVGPLPELAEFQHTERTIAGAGCSVRRRDLLGMPGYDVVCDAASAASVRQAVVSAGAEVGTPEQFEQLRVNAGTPLYGPDIDESRFVMEVGDAARAVSYSKGCYLGQEPIVMSRDRAGHAPRSFVRLTMAGDPPPVGAKILAGEEEAGAVTSAARGTGNGSVALGYVRWKHREPGTPLTIDGQPAEVTA
jgi:folate-binding protein YgfZ